MSDRIIVTGGAGFIGSNIVAALNARGHDDILIVDHLGHTQKWKNLNGLRFADFLGKDDFIKLVKQGALAPPRAVFHMGACSATTETDADYLMENNYRYTRQLCKWTLGAGSRFIYASSAATYGGGEHGYDDSEAASHLLRPLNMYGYSKQLFDQWAIRTRAVEQIAGLKFFNVYGPGEDHKGDMRSVVHKSFKQVRETGEITLFKSYKPEYPDGGQTRDFVYVADAVKVALHFLDNWQTSGIFNCGTGKARTWVDLAKAVFNAMGKEPNIRFIEMPETMRDKYQYHTEATLKNLRAAGYADEFMSIEDGVADYARRQGTAS